MDTVQVTMMKKVLIKKELETTSWENLCELAKKQVQLTYEAMSEEVLKSKCLEASGTFSGDLGREIEGLVTTDLIGATRTDVLAAALKTLEREYDELDDRDLNSLYQIFVASNLILGIEEDDIETDENIILSKQAA